VQNSTLFKLFAALTVLIFVMVAILNFSKINAPETAKTPPTFAKDHDYSATYKPLFPKVANPKPELDGDAKSESDEKEEPKLPRDKVEAWLGK
jgi:hypothetical protein